MSADPAAEFASALVAARRQLRNIVAARTATIPGKGTRSGYGYTYANLPDVIDGITDTLAEHGLCITQDVHNGDNCDRVSVSTIVDHTSGHSRTYGPLTIAVPTAETQRMGSAVTYARRYALLAAVGLSAAGDDDGRAAQQAAEREQARRDALAQRVKRLRDEVRALDTVDADRVRGYAKDKGYELTPSALVADPDALDDLELYVDEVRHDAADRNTA